jgi:hypothetical protein
MRLERILCAIFGHRYVVERQLNERTRKVGCTRCAQHWAMHDPTRCFVRWDDELKAMYMPGGVLAPSLPEPQPEGMRQAASDEFNRTFHKVRAEVSMDWWQRIWAKAVAWQDSALLAGTASIQADRRIKGVESLRTLIATLRECGRFDDEEGEFTNDLADLLAYVDAIPVGGVTS